MFSEYDDITVANNDLTQSKGLTLLAIVRNEIYLIPAFLEHYRALGIERFVILDDQSDDGTAEFLSEQSDVMLVKSKSRFGELVSPAGRIPLPDMRSNVVWRNVLMGKYAFGRWAVMLDADEFIVLPPGMGLQDVADHVEAGRRAVQGIMLDCYPLNLSELSESRPFDPHVGWHFDGQPHLRLSTNGAVSVLYPGARARLMVQCGLKPLSTRTRLRNLVKKPWYPGFNLNSKVVLHCWGESDLFLNSHKTTAPASGRVLLPIKHYKFTSDVYRKINASLAERRHAGGSVEYNSLSAMLVRMSERGGSFRYRCSRLAGRFEDFIESGNAHL